MKRILLTLSALCSIDAWAVPCKIVLEADGMSHVYTIPFGDPEHYTSHVIKWRNRNHALLSSSARHIYTSFEALNDRMKRYNGNSASSDIGDKIRSVQSNTLNFEQEASTFVGYVRVSLRFYLGLFNADLDTRERGQRELLDVIDAWNPKEKEDFYAFCCQRNSGRKVVSEMDFIRGSSIGFPPDEN